MNAYFSLALTMATIFIPVFATIYTGYIRIKNENREEHKPYLVLGEIKKLSMIDSFVYYFIIRGKRFLKKDKKQLILDSKKSENILLSLTLTNIGYGVASNIKLYNLSTAKPILGVQERSESLNQKRFTTFDISKDTEKSFQTCILVSQENEEIVPERHYIVCAYQDLNHNIYDFIIGIDVKKEGTYDFFAYQRSSHSYSRLVSTYKSKYRSIMKQYRK